ncbi:MAG: eukaryotic-like serine/threonine-protein kinase [Thermomicrobiales bacterium]|nr:eukaryotic-like serine/threonine-protein kinase [Thermomicrobiales bacterium]
MANREQEDALDRFLDRLARGEPGGSPSIDRDASLSINGLIHNAPRDLPPFDPDLAEVVLRYRALLQGPVPVGARERVRRRLASSSRPAPRAGDVVPFPTIAAAATKSPVGLPAPGTPLPDGRAVKSPSPTVRRCLILRRLWTMLELAAVLALIFSVAVILNHEGAELRSGAPGPIGPIIGGSPFDSGWTSFRGKPGNTGESNGTTAVGLPSVRWHAPIAAVKASAAVAGGIVFTGSETGDLVALDVETGTERWRSAVLPARFAGSAPGISFSSPAVAGGLVYVGSANGVYALDSGSGATRWHAARPMVVSSPVVVDGVVYVGDSGGGLSALDAATGQERWRFDAAVALSSPAVAAGTVYVATRAGDQPSVLYAIDAATGLERWRFELTDPGEVFPWSPSATDGAVYVWGVAAPGRRTLYAVDAQTGNERWRFARDGDMWDTAVMTWDASPAVADGVVYAALEESGNASSHRSSVIYALDSTTGRERWHVEIPGWLSASPVVVEDVVYASGGGIEGSGQLVAVNAETGRLLWQVAMAGPLGASPAVAGGTVFLPVAGGDLYAMAVDG